MGLRVIERECGGVGGCLDCGGLYGNVWDCMGVQGGCMGLRVIERECGGVGGCLDCRGLYGTVYDGMVLCGTLCDCMGV